MRVTSRAENIDAIMPSVRVTAKPLTEPVACQKRITAVIRVGNVGVKYRAKSLIVGSLECRGERFAGRRLFAQPFVDENIGVYGHTHRQDDSGNTGKGQHKVNIAIAPKRMTMFTSRPTNATMPAKR